MPVTNYPHFVANQVLTSAQLNNMFAYLDSQNRLTRIRLIGTGIVCGLNARLESEGDQLRLIISEGYGVTSDGHLIHLPETEYNQLRSYQDSFPESEDLPAYPPFMNAAGQMIPLQELISDPLPPGFINLPPAIQLKLSDLSGKVLILYLEKMTEDLKSCFTTDCNNKGQEISLNLRVILADKAQLAALPHWFAPENNCNQPAAQIHVPRLFAGIMVKGATPGKRLYDINNSTEITAAYRDIANFLRGEIIARIDAFFNDDAFKTFLHLFDQDKRVDGLADRLEEIVTAADFSQYHYDVLQDIAQAYNEFARQYCEIIAPCCPPGHFPCHLVLQDFVVSGSSVTATPGYRHHFYPAPIRNVNHNELERTQKLFRRMLALPYHFRVPQAAVSPLKITPSQHEGHLLSERAIPYYYRDGSNQLPEEIRQLWRPQMCCDAPPLSYADNAMALPALADADPETPDYANYLPNPLHYNLNGHSHYRIEGHLGRTYAEIIGQLRQMRSIFNLEFQIQPLFLNGGQLVVPPDLLSSIDASWTAIGDLWQAIYNLALSPQFDEGQYKELLEELQGWEAALTDIQAKWTDWRNHLYFPCDLSALESDYLVLRSELLGLLRKIRPLLGTRPAVSASEPRQVCVTFDSLPANTRFGQGINQQGATIFTENGIRVTAEFFIWNSSGAGTFGNADVRKDNNGQSSVWFNNINFKFHFSDLGFTPTQVTFIAADFGGTENIAVNDRQVTPIEISQFTTEREIAPGVTFHFAMNPNARVGVGTLRGNISNFTIGGQEFLLDQVCATGVALTDGQIQSVELDIREEKLRQRTRLLLQSLPKDLRFFNFPLFSHAFKDWADTVIQIKLIFCKIFDATEEEILHYRNFPAWQEYLYALNLVHYACLYTRLSGMYYTLNSLLTPSFKHFAEHHPGMEHRAGVSPGGAFIVLCSNDDTVDYQQAEVIADFALQAGTCCCVIDPARCLPPVALSDYRIVEISEEPTDLFIDVRDNDIDLNDGQDVIVSTSGISALGVPYRNNGQQIQYLYSQVSKPAAFAGRIDHFQYTAVNGACNLEDRGNVWILFKGTVVEPPQLGPGRITGSVFYNDLDRSVAAQNATARVYHAESNEIVETSNSNNRGDFSFTLPAGVYNLEITYRCFRRLINAINVNNEQTNALGAIGLSLAPPPRIQPDKTIIVTDRDLLPGRSYQWTKNNVYILDGLVYLEAGSELNIERGTIIKGRTAAGRVNPPSALIVTRGARIYAKGTPSEPIIFTAELDDLSQTADIKITETGLWGGVILLGAAPIGENVSTEEGVPIDILPGFSADDKRNRYGGKDANDNSGILTHVSIRYAGGLLGRQISLNGLTLAGAGAGTIVDFVETFTCRGNGIGIQGGTVNIKHAISAFCAGNSFNTDEAWDGNGQFWFAIHFDQIKGFGLNASQHEGSESRELVSRPVPNVYNVTFIGAGLGSDNQNSSALLMRNDGAVGYGNSIFTDFPGLGLQLADTSLESYVKQRRFRLPNNIWFGFNEQNMASPTANTSDIIKRLIQDKNDLFVDPELYSISRKPDGLLDPRPKANSPALGNVINLPDNSFFDKALYRGAFAPDDLLWMKCWTCLDEYGYLPRGGNVDNFQPLDILKARIDARRDVIGGLTANIAAAERTTLTSSQNFMDAQILDANAKLSDINKSFTNLSGALTKSLQTAQGRDKNLVTQVLRQVSLAYFDRVVVENPQKLDAAAEKNIARLVKTMNETAISTNTLLTDWKSNELKTLVGSDAAINEIRTLLKG